MISPGPKTTYIVTPPVSANNVKTFIIGCCLYLRKQKINKNRLNSHSYSVVNSDEATSSSLFSVAQAFGSKAHLISQIIMVEINC